MSPGRPSDPAPVDRPGPPPDPDDAPQAPPRLLLGPLLRYADAREATIWVETDRPCRVEVRGADVTDLTGSADGTGPTERSWGEPTWSVHGHHFALVALDGLEPGSVIAYRVLLDGEQAWPEPGSPFPASVIRTFADSDTFRLTFGSCRRAAPMDAENLARYGADALVALAERMTVSGYHDWPDTLFLAGDQVYADEPSDALRHRLARRRDRDGRTPDPDGEVREELQTFEEYTWLYHESWREPAVRWLLSTVPSVMLLDDHDLRDDWNTSLSWRRWATAQPWWRERVIGAFSSYWVYQHLGNLSPQALADDGLYQALRAEPDQGRRNELLDDFAWRADAEPARTRWSVHREFGHGQLTIRLILLDARCSRVLDPKRRRIVDDQEWAWLRELVLADGDLDHLLIASTLPMLLPPGVHELEGWNEAVATGAWGRSLARLGEWVRQAVDLEHWASFRDSMGSLCELLVEVARRGQPPASILLLGGDVHSSYLATAEVDGIDPASTSVVQLTMSPFRNPLNLPIRAANRILLWPPAYRTLRLLRRGAGVEDLPLCWSVDHGIWFDNGLMTVVLAGRRAMVEVDHAAVAAGRQMLRRTHAGTLTRADGPSGSQPGRPRVAVAAPRRADEDD